MRLVGGNGKVEGDVEWKHELSQAATRELLSAVRAAGELPHGRGLESWSRDGVMSASILDFKARNSF